MKKIFYSLLLATLSLSAVAQESPKYIFYFIGDGMGYEHVKLTGEELCFESFPTKGSVATRSSSDEVTDSAAAGTALASGQKTSNGTLGMNAAHTKKLTSIIPDARAAGLSTAVLSSVSLDHATPAAFYAHVPKRSMYYEVSGFVAASGIDILAGAGFKDPKGNIAKIKKAGYQIVSGGDAELTGNGKFVWIQTEGKDENQVPYKVERGEGDMALPDMVEEVVENLEQRPRGFLVVAEGGLIDWGSHENSAEKTRGEVEDFDEAVAEALEFYKEHPAETLIIVTADHETGGLSFDSNGTAQWSSGGHTAADVPIYAIGVGAENFSGKMDNTDVPRKIRELLK